MTFVDPGAKELIDRLSERVTALEQRMHEVLARFEGDSPPAGSGWGFGDDAATEDDEALALLREGKVIEAISTYRQRTGVGLREAKDAIDRLKAEHGL